MGTCPRKRKGCRSDCGMTKTHGRGGVLALPAPHGHPPQLLLQLQSPSHEIQLTPAAPALRFSPSGRCTPWPGNPCVARKTTTGLPSGASSPSPACPQCSVGRGSPLAFSPAPTNPPYLARATPMTPESGADPRARCYLHVEAKEAYSPPSWAMTLGDKRGRTKAPSACLHPTPARADPPALAQPWPGLQIS